MSCNLKVTVATASSGGDIPITNATVSWDDAAGTHTLAADISGSALVVLTGVSKALISASAPGFDGSGVTGICNTPLLIKLDQQGTGGGGGGGGGGSKGPTPTDPTDLQVAVSGYSVTLNWKAGSNSTLFKIWVVFTELNGEPSGNEDGPTVQVPGGSPANVGEEFSRDFTLPPGAYRFEISGGNSQGAYSPGALSNFFYVIIPPVFGSALTSFALDSGYTRLYYLDDGGSVHELGYISSEEWEHTPLQSQQGGVSAARGSALTSFALNGNSTRLYYLDGAAWVHELGWTGSGWEHTSLQSTQAGASAAPGSALASFALNGGYTRLYYLDDGGWVHELGWTGSGWEHTPLQSQQGGVSAARGSALTSFALNGNSTRLYYLDGAGWVHELGWTGSGWEHTSLQSTQAGASAAPGSALASFALNGGYTRLYYLDDGGWVHELGWTGSGWEHTPLQSQQGGVSAARGSALTSFALNGNSTRLYYLDGAGWVHELGWTGSGWEHTSLQSTQAGLPAGASAAPGSALTSFALNNGYTRLYYLDSGSIFPGGGQDNGGWVHELGWTGGGWEQTNLFVAVMYLAYGEAEAD